MTTNKLQSIKRAAFFTLLATSFFGCGDSSNLEKLQARSKPVSLNESQKSSDANPVSLGEPAARFELTDQEGNQFDSASLKGKVWMGSVFFANCPGPCFRENQAIADILREIDDPNFVAVSLTCDPENDTPAALEHYADRFEADPQRWKFLTGDMDVIKRVGTKTFLLPVEIGVHSERGAVFDREGRLRGSYHLLQEDRVERLKKLIRDVLAEEDTSVNVEGPN
jgi:cytochrome oxidase Cu insertion factor (SCO1/SenC/PrrC family)|tara:strand:+ start:433 stop:1104 length:672 start_codon:yes stop_codon:yes gene_type:complete